MPARGTPRVTEEQEQRVLAQWLDLRGLLWCHVPNGGARHAATAARLRTHGVKAGVPDVLIFDQPPHFPAARGAAIELKVADGRVSKLQAAWGDALAARGWRFVVAYSASEAIRWCQALGY